MANMAQAIRMALHYGEKHLDVKDIFGEDVGPPLGGVFTATQGLKTTWNSPLDERGIIGAAMGIAMTGDRCVAEVQFCDYIFNTIDLLKLAGATCWSGHGQYALPMVVMTPTGSGIHGSIYHSHSFDSWASRLCGWKVVIPSNPIDAYGLMISAIEDPNPVLYLKPKSLLRVRGTELIPGEFEDFKKLRSMIDAPIDSDRSKWKAKWPPLKKHNVPIGKAKICCEGTDLTVVSYGRTLPLCEKVAQKISSETSIEVIDLRSIYPYDWQCIKSSVMKTKKVLFVNEDTEVSNFCEHLCYRTIQECFYELLAKPRVLSGKNIPGIGLHPNLENYTVPQEETILKEIRLIIQEQV